MMEVVARWKGEKFERYIVSGACDKNAWNSGSKMNRGGGGGKMLSRVRWMGDWTIKCD